MRILKLLFFTLIVSSSLAGISQEIIEPIGFLLTENNDTLIAINKFEKVEFKLEGSNQTFSGEIIALDDSTFTLADFNIFNTKEVKRMILKRKTAAPYPIKKALLTSGGSGLAVIFLSGLTLLTLNKAGGMLTDYSTIPAGIGLVILAVGIVACIPFVGAFWLYKLISFNRKYVVEILRPAKKQKLVGIKE